MLISNIILIGDIHYPITKHLKMLDNKHADESTNLIPTQINKSKLSFIVEKIKQTCGERSIDYIVFVGDYTDIGNEADFKNCLEYFERSLESVAVPLVGVPGNHDLKRPEDFSDNSEKFRVFEALAEKSNFEINFSENPIVKTLPDGINSAIYLVNSCLGCQELWLKAPSPTSAKKSVIDIIVSKFKDIAGSSKSILNEADLYERFDAPYICNNSSDAVLDHIVENGISLPLFVAHHNIFPQKQPRIALFPEMLNAGYIRDALAEVQGPVIYLHGHIHEDPVKILVDPDKPEKINLVSISAPRIDDGFIELSWGFSETGNPVAMRARSQRFTNFEFQESERIISFVPNNDIRSLVLPTECIKLREKLKVENAIRYHQAREEFGPKIIEYMEIIGEISIRKEISFEPNTWTIQSRID